MRTVFMMASLAVALVFLSVGCRKSSQSGSATTAAPAAAASAPRDWSAKPLTDVEVNRFVETLPHLAKITEQAGKRADGATNVATQYMTGMQHSKEYLAMLQQHGWSSWEDFAVVHQQIVLGWTALKTQAAMAATQPDVHHAETAMQKQLDDPQVPEAVKAQLRASMEQMKAGMQQTTANVSGVAQTTRDTLARNQNALEQLFQSWDHQQTDNHEQR